MRIPPHCRKTRDAQSFREAPSCLRSRATPPTTNIGATRASIPSGDHNLCCAIEASKPYPLRETGEKSEDCFRAYWKFIAVSCFASGKVEGTADGQRRVGRSRCGHTLPYISFVGVPHVRTPVSTIKALVRRRRHLLWSCFLMKRINYCSAGSQCNVLLVYAVRRESVSSTARDATPADYLPYYSTFFMPQKFPTI